MQISLTASDWAAWVQAIGSVSAIVVAILVMRHQSVSERKLEQARRDLDKIHRFESVRAVMTLVHGFITEVQKELQRGDFEELAESSVKSLVVVDQAVKAIPIIDVPNNEQTVMVLALYGAATDLGDALSKFCSGLHEDQRHRDKKALADIFRKIKNIRLISQNSKDRCESSIKVLQAKLPLEMSYSMKEGAFSPIEDSGKV